MGGKAWLGFKYFIANIASEAIEMRLEVMCQYIFIRKSTTTFWAFYSWNHRLIYRNLRCFKALVFFIFIFIQDKHTLIRTTHYLNNGLSGTRQLGLSSKISFLAAAFALTSL